MYFMRYMCIQLMWKKELMCTKKHLTQKNIVPASHIHDLDTNRRTAAHSRTQPHTAAHRRTQLHTRTHPHARTRTVFHARYRVAKTHRMP